MFGMFKDSADSEMIGQIDDEKVKMILKSIEKNSGIVGLLVVTQGWWKLFFRQLWIGVGRGLGMTVGCTIVLGVIYQILAYFISFDIPYLTELLKQIVAIIKGVN